PAGESFKVESRARDQASAAAPESSSCGVMRPSSSSLMSSGSGELRHAPVSTRASNLAVESFNLFVLDTLRNRCLIKRRHFGAGVSGGQGTAAPTGDLRLFQPAYRHLCVVVLHTFEQHCRDDVQAPPFATQVAACAGVGATIDEMSGSATDAARPTRLMTSRR